MFLATLPPGGIEQFVAEATSWLPSKEGLVLICGPDMAVELAKRMPAMPPAPTDAVPGSLLPTFGMPRSVRGVPVRVYCSSKVANGEGAPAFIFPRGFLALGIPEENTDEYEPPFRVVAAVVNSLAGDYERAIRIADGVNDLLRQLAKMKKQRA